MLNLNHADYLVNSELFYRNISHFEGFFCTYNNNVPRHLSKGEFETLKNQTNLHSKI